MGKAVLRLGVGIGVLAAMLFLAAGRWNWALGWAYIASYAIVTALGLRVVPMDPQFIEERTRMKQDVKAWDKALSGIGGLLYPTAILILAGLDQRLGWTPPIALGIELAALGVATFGNLLSVWAMAVNRFYSRFVRIQKERGHVTVSDGPYRYVRHPGYLGTLLCCLASPLALGSLWTLIPGGLFALLLAVRTFLEDRTLQEELEGYREYAARVRFRLLPGVW
jgi:protein-S-isoprenylcysteine O-methyltransferase Ste14